MRIIQMFSFASTLK